MLRYVPRGTQVNGYLGANGLKGGAGKVHKREESSVIQENLFVPQCK